MPVTDKPFDSEAVAVVGASREDPWAMYYVVRKDRALTLGQAMSLAGAGAVACADAWRDSLRWGEAFAAWQEQSYRKVVLRADAAQFQRLRAELDCAVVDGPEGETVLCLPPCRRSERAPLLDRLRA
jgi:hypothetical protein